jgi:hypothetical protein
MTAAADPAPPSLNVNVVAVVFAVHAGADIEMKDSPDLCTFFYV